VGRAQLVPRLRERFRPRDGHLGQKQEEQQQVDGHGETFVGSCSHIGPFFGIRRQYRKLGNEVLECSLLFFLVASCS